MGSHRRARDRREIMDLLQSWTGVLKLDPNRREGPLLVSCLLVCFSMLLLSGDRPDSGITGREKE